MHDCGRGLRETSAKMCRHDKLGSNASAWGDSYLVIWENERVSHDDIFPSCSIEYHDFSDIIRSKGLAAAVEY